MYTCGDVLIRKSTACKYTVKSVNYKECMYTVKSVATGKLWPIPFKMIDKLFVLKH